ARAVRVDRSELLLQEAPIHRARQRHQRMLHVDDLIEPGAKQILLAGITPRAHAPHANVACRESDRAGSETDPACRSRAAPVAASKPPLMHSDEQRITTADSTESLIRSCQRSEEHTSELQS